MGYSTPKKPFDLGEFLSEKAATRTFRRPNWQRRSASAVITPDEPEDEAATGQAPALGAE